VYESTLSIMLILMFLLFILVTLYVALKTINSAKGIGDVSVVQTSLNRINDAIVSTFTRVTLSTSIKESSTTITINVIPGEYFITCNDDEILLAFVPSTSDIQPITIKFPLDKEYKVDLQVINEKNNKIEPRTMIYKVRVNGMELNKICNSKNVISLGKFTTNAQATVRIIIQRIDPLSSSEYGYFDVNIEIVK